VFKDAVLSHSENYVKNHAVHAAFVVAKHDVVPMDVVAIDTAAGQRLYSFLSVGWGLISDVDIESERYRSMGNARFTLMAIVKIAGAFFMSQMTIACRLTFIADFSFSSVCFLMEYLHQRADERHGNPPPR